MKPIGPSTAVAWLHPPVESPSRPVASGAAAAGFRSRLRARSAAGCSPGCVCTWGYMEVSIVMGVPKMDALEGTIQLKWGYISLKKAIEQGNGGFLKWGYL